MDSLLANYASSDEEEDPQQPSKPAALPSKPSSEPSSSSSLFSSLPKPKPQTSSLFQSLPQPKQTQTKPSNLRHDDDDDDEDQDSKPTSKPLFSTLPPPKSQIPNKPITNISSSDRNPKRVVQFKPPISSYSMKSSQLDDEDDDDDEEEERRRQKASESSAQTSSGKFIFSLPAPRYSATLGASSGLGSGRRAILETESVGSKVKSDAGVDQNGASYENHQSSIDQNAVNYESYGGYETYQSGIDQNAVNYESYGGYESNQSGIDQNVDVEVQLQAGISGSDASNYGSYDVYGSNAGYCGYGQYGNDWVGGSETAALAIPGTDVSAIKVSKKRGRNEVPTEIVEVKQDELMKNRPREDQAKSTGIAFGPSYQPVSTKGKPTKLHKRKHQIGSLYFDMRQKEMELAERRSKGFLTKAETQAKYGW
ncbi:PREDICTED: proline-rich [Prunus dulcis]|uniref:PREDICTED: proline-rich n=1 Tax=Prunus dulcis TaxID=3755 RepID=A0A5E4FN07_PRUDU|nr:ubiquitin carboxyl-terminal hydrolase 36 [Prunus dulcis]VVA28258.1 PREDICTED: proline-rich [Prunus dulcis]